METNEPEAFKLAGPPESKTNLTAIARQIWRTNPDWTAKQVKAHLEEAHQVKVTNNLVYNARTAVKNPRHHFQNDTSAKMLAEAMAQAITPEDIRKITKVLVEKCKRGDLDAITLLHNRLWGKPINHLTKDTVSTTTTINMATLNQSQLDQLETIISPQPTYEAEVTQPKPKQLTEENGWTF